MSNESRIAKLIVKQLNHPLTSAEREELDAWLDESPGNREFMESSTREEVLAAGTRVLFEKDGDAIRQQFERLRKEDRRRGMRGKLMRTTRYAAAAVLMICFVGYGVLLWHRRQEPPDAAGAGTLIAGQVRDPVVGENRAILALSNGRRINLDNVPKGLVAEQDGFRIVKNDSNRIVCLRSAGGTGSDGAGGVTHGQTTLRVLPGSKYWIEFPDGSVAQVNTNSLLSFSTAFGGMERRVKIDGEAFFTIARDPQRPFIVNSTAGPEVHVLGTEFNVHAYPNEDRQWITLQGGKVAVHKDGLRAQLSPGQEAQTKNGSALIQLERKANMDRRLAWRYHTRDSGYLQFDRPHLEETLWKIVQWYGLKDFRLEKGAGNATFPAGRLEGGLPLDKVLQYLRRPDLKVYVDSTKEHLIISL